MSRWLYVVLHLVSEGHVARRGARLRFPAAPIEIHRRKLCGSRVILSPDDRARLLAIGQKLNHDDGDATGIVTPQMHFP
jgi:hypothetical protein